MIKILLLKVLRFYQRWVSPLLGSHCRFYPSCSQYAVDALSTLPVIRALGLIVRRLLCCHPWHPGGVQFVPSSHEIRKQD